MVKMKRILCVLLSICFLLQLLPASAATETPFKDVDETHWFYDAVTYVYENGLMNGMSSTEFGPNKPLSRAMFVTILGRMAGIEPNSYTGTSFSDVPEGQWYSPYVQWASENEIVNGYGNGEFCPQNNVTREQMATMIARYVQTEEISLSSDSNAVESFRDADKISGWAEEGVELMRVNGLLQGDNKGYFNPKNTATRAQAATLFTRLHQAVTNVNPIPEGASDLGNGDSIYILTDDMVALDEETMTRYVKDIVYAYVDDGLTWDEKEALAASVGGTIAGDITSAINILQIRVDASSLQELKDISEVLLQNPVVHYASYDIAFPSASYLASSGNATTTPANMQWYDLIEAEYVHDHYSSILTPATVGIIDSGILDNHSDFSNISFISKGSEQQNQLSIQALSQNPPIDKISHGTSVTGIIHAKDDGIGMTGISPDSPIIFSSKEPYPHYWDNIPQGPDPDWGGWIDWTNLSSIVWENCMYYIYVIAEQIEQGAKVINCSFGGGYPLSEFGYYEKKVEAASEGKPWPYKAYSDYCVELNRDKDESARLVAAGILELIQNGKDKFLIVQAAGNGFDKRGPGIFSDYTYLWASITEENCSVVCQYYQKSFQELKDHFLIVTGTTEIDGTYPYKIDSDFSYGENVDICAPGRAIYTTNKDNGYDPTDGTSFAAPIVTAVAALVWSVNPDLEAKEVSEILLNNYRYTATREYDNSKYLSYADAQHEVFYDKKTYSYPIVNARLAVEAAIRTTCTSDIHYYEVITEEVSSWEEAQTLCESYGGHLATITSDEENAHVFALMQKSDVDSAYFGLSDSAEEDHWEWVNGEASFYRNWNPGEPNRESENEDYAMFYYKYPDGTWNDGDFGGSTVNGGTAFICEWDTKQAYYDYKAFNEVGLYNQFLLETDYCGLLEENYMDKDHVIVSSCLIDIDNDKIDEALVVVNDPWGTISLTLDIVNAVPVLTNSVYASRGTMGGDEIELRYDQQDMRFVFVNYGYYRALQAAAIGEITVYSDCCKTVSQRIRTESINMTDGDYEYSFAEKVKNIMAETDLYLIEDGYFTYWTINSTYVDQNSYRDATNRYTALNATHAYYMYTGTYDRPFHPDSYVG